MRKYRIASDGGEQPIWAARKTLVEMGTRAGIDAYWRTGKPPLNWGNLTFDEAALKAYNNLAKVKS